MIVQLKISMEPWKELQLIIGSSISIFRVWALGDIVIAATAGLASGVVVPGIVAIDSIARLGVESTKVRQKINQVD